MNKFKTRDEIIEEVKKMSHYEKDVIYRYVWSEYVKDDIESQCESRDIMLTEEAIDEIVNRYVYEGDYDCNLSYWDNIDNLIDEYNT